MPLFLFKTLLSLLSILLGTIALVSMLEITGRKEPTLSLTALRTVHRLNGIVYFIAFFFIGYLCLKYVSRVDAELSPRSALHGMFAACIAVAFGLKLLFVRAYKNYYPYARLMGLSMVVMTFLLFALSGGYYFVAKVIGQGDRPVKATASAEPSNRLSITVGVPTDNESIAKGLELFGAKCSFCHDPSSDKTIVGPGLKGVLKHDSLPRSHRPAIAENIKGQLRAPYRDMPAFTYLQDAQVLQIISYLNTL